MAMDKAQLARPWASFSLAIEHGRLLPVLMVMGKAQPARLCASFSQPIDHGPWILQRSWSKETVGHLKGDL